MSRFPRLILLLGALVATGLACAVEVAARPERISPYQARADRLRPLIAVVGENSGTELTDFVIPYAVLARSGVADVLSVATRPGVLKLRPWHLGSTSHFTKPGHLEFQAC